MSWSSEKFLNKFIEREINLPVHFTDKETGNVETEIVHLKVRELPYFTKQEIATRHVSYSIAGEGKFDYAGYSKECLKQIIVEAPWGKTDDLFLLQIGDELGSALSTLIPNAFGNVSFTKNIENVKKELPDSYTPSQ